MIRPIDTQIIHPQTPEIAGRQQKTNHIPIEQQSQFGEIMEKEVEHKKKTIIGPKNSENIKVDKEDEKESAKQKKKKSKKKQKSKNVEKEDVQTKSVTKIDIRI